MIQSIITSQAIKKITRHGKFKESVEFPPKWGGASMHFLALTLDTKAGKHNPARVSSANVWHQKTISCSNWFEYFIENNINKTCKRFNGYREGDSDSWCLVIHVVANSQKFIQMVPADELKLSDEEEKERSELNAEYWSISSAMFKYGNLQIRVWMQLHI